VNISATHLPITASVLLDILRDIPYIEFDMNLAWDGEPLLSLWVMDNRTKILSRLVFTRPVGLLNGFRTSETCRGSFRI
jgi:hypothetical protein